ncbi:multidrug ABC transporter ATP-binding protein [Pseudoroseomonas deserti]|uniref:Multidrug ABC transporter ATP-binding protein n=1 Tax=Teichococcus deserti TaxID=1817963 RepID=A0A1V2GV42_9PROT|nr:ABC transporter ATP-binding protein [Pseudoroseomonas deserti]ONG45373.1 multidrug ABC transporter ATP-binding protein [Pseudoroseomonas deserti]
MTPDPKPAEPFRRVIPFLLRQWARHPWLLAAILGGMGLATLTDVLVPIYAGRLVEAIASAGPLDGSDREAALDQALAALGLLALLGLALLAGRVAGILGVIALTLRSMQHSGAGAFARVQRFSADWHASGFAGATVRRISRGIWAIDLLNDTILIALLPSALVLVGATVTLGWRWPAMGLLVAVGGTLYVAMTLFLSLRWVAPALRLSNGWDSRLGGAMADAIGANTVVKAFAAEAREDDRLGWLLDKWRRRTRRGWQRGTASEALQIATLLALRIAVIGIALLLWWRGEAGAGDVATVLTMFFMVQGYLRDVGYHISNLQRGINEMEEFVQLFHTPQGIADAADAVPAQVAAGTIEFRKVTFRYGGHAEPLYRDLDLTIRAGESVGLVGPSGSGKTTLVKLIQRLHDVTGGAVLIDGQDVRGVTQASLRSRIAIVQQEPVLLHRSLAENISYARPGASMADIARAARLANAEDFIERLPRGYATLVGERGVKLSGGERQRVALARAFLADAPILILDEATSALDSESEAAIQQAMARLLQGRTAVVIAHRLATVRAMDRILVFDRGRVVEEGSHASLLDRPAGLYRRLFERQALELTQGH